MGLSCLVDSSLKLVLDTSTAINLNATGCAASVLRALPFESVVTDVVFSELKEDWKNGRQDRAMLEELITAGLLQVESLDDTDDVHFGNLVIGPGADTLDDGEAATIARSVCQNAVAVLDERKARRICAERYPTLQLASTIDLLCHESVVAALGDSLLANAVFSSLQNARMRVLPNYLDWVVALIGPARAETCKSLPLSSRN